MAKWDESKHPRDPGGEDGGQFVRKGAGWVHAVVNRIGGGGGYHPGTDLRESVDYDAIAALMPLPYHTEGTPDRALAEIYRLQGYHGKPEVLTKSQMDRRIAEGWTELWRGVARGWNKEHHGRGPEQLAAIAETYRSGDEHYPGQGIYGNGSYAAPRRRAATQYASFVDPGDWQKLSDAERDDAYDDDSNWPSLLRIALRPDARVITHEALVELYHQGPAEDSARSIPGQRSPWIDREDRTPRQQTLVDMGRFAAMLGYDAIKHDADYEPTYVILNRSATAVQEAYPRWRSG